MTLCVTNWALKIIVYCKHVYQDLLIHDERFNVATELTLDVSDRTQGERELRPDICIYHAEDFDFIASLEADDLLKGSTMPLLAIEILSPTQSENEMIAKVRTYFALRVKSRWLVSPPLKVITIYAPTGHFKIYEMADGEVIDNF